MEMGQFSGYEIIGDPKQVRIDNNVSFGGNVKLFAVSNIEIGEHSMISINVLIHTATHNYYNHPMWIERVDMPVKIGKHTWIGAGAVICPGIKIGDYAVIGAGSLVNSHVPERAIVGGNPARIIKYRDIDPQLIDTLLPDYPNNSFITKQTFLPNEKTTKLKDKD